MRTACGSGKGKQQPHQVLKLNEKEQTAPAFFRRRERELFILPLIGYYKEQEFLY